MKAKFNWINIVVGNVMHIFFNYSSRPLLCNEAHVLSSSINVPSNLARKEIFP